MTNNEFLPKEYEVPASKGNYMKFQEGANRFRILSSPIIGYEWFEEKEDGTKKPVRVAMGVTLPKLDGIKHFWAMPIWDYEEEKVKILEITQKGLMTSIKALASDEDWGSPVNYDLVVTREGKSMDTKYSLNPKPAKELSGEIIIAFKEAHVDLDALFRGEDPFAVK